jgi:hypothetical protein
VNYEEVSPIMRCQKEEKRKKSLARRRNKLIKEYDKVRMIF